jgi:hypothetical protein
MPVAVAANAIVSWAEYKAALAVTDDTEQDRYQDLINKASARIELYTRRSLKAQDYTSAAALVLDGSGRDTLVLPHHPVNTISKLYIDTGRAFLVSSEVGTTEFSLRKAEGMIILYAGTFPRGIDIVKVECNAGYASTTPEWVTLQTACLELVRWMSSRFAGFIGKRSETNADGMNIGYEIEIPLNIRSMIDPFVEVSA